MFQSFLKILAKTAVAILIIVCHLAIAAVIILGMKGLEFLTHSGNGDLLFFDRFPVRYLFHSIDIATILCFGVLGLWDAITEVLK